MVAPDAAHDLVLVRDTYVPRAILWKGWTQSKYLVRWFTPTPWVTTEAQIDLRPGGAFRTVMRGPEGQGHDSTGCILDVVANERLVWTSALGAGFRPQASYSMPFTAVLTFADHAGGTRYTARAMHGNAEDTAKHAAMGFEVGWGKAFDQLVALAGEIR